MYGWMDGYGWIRRMYGYIDAWMGGYMWMHMINYMNPAPSCNKNDGCVAFIFHQLRLHTSERG
jgi:hypothetical protein